MGRTRVGAEIDAEFGSRLGVPGIGGTSLFSYVRCDADLSDTSLASIGIRAPQAQQRVRKLDSVEAMDDLRTVGRRLAASVEIEPTSPASCEQIKPRGTVRDTSARVRGDLPRVLRDGILDGSVLNVAIPAIRKDLHASLASAQWVLNAYTLTLAGLLLTAGALGDRIGLRRMLLFGTTLFTAASVACAAAPSIPVLIVARVVQGLGAAALLPATLALIPYLFQDAARRGRATVVWVGIGAGAVALGPLVGGLLIDAFRWRSVSLINLPLGS